ncbi:MAG: helix-turn-helix transcriptional regulator [Saprospiraceae bacterium]
MNKLKNIEREYYQLLSQQIFDESEINYDIFNKQIPFLNQMAKVKNSAISVFDLFKKEHIYNSFNLQNLFGYNISDISTEYYNSRIYPDDLISLMQTGILVLRYFYKLPISEKQDYKLQNEYRILNDQNEYIRIIEQFQVLELDKKGNIWLAISTMDISPNQELYHGIRSQLINISTGKIKVIKTQNNNLVLSKRESEILSFVNDGLLSKEISTKLSISIHTVNTHRQNILKKLGANNSLEAIKFVKNMNLI